MAPRFMLQLMQMMFALVRNLFADRGDLAMENLALRQQLAILKREKPRPLLDDLDRAFWVALKKELATWAAALIIVKPETVVRWQKLRFRKHWAKKSGRPPGRPSVSKEVRELIRKMATSNPTYVKPTVMWNQPDSTASMP